MGTLSVCCLTGDPGPRVAAILEPLREVADEIVVAADSRAGGDRLRHYAAVADQLLRVEFDGLERHLAWLHEQCSGDWVFRIDADEVASPELVTLLPELIARRDVDQYWFPRRWLFGDSGHWLDEHPWTPDYQVRLVRNSGSLRFPGLPHTSASADASTRRTSAPIYHLDCLLHDAEQRRSKALRYEVDRPGLRTPAGLAFNHVYYLPERWARRPGAAVPAADRAAIDAALAGSPLPAGAPPAPPVRVVPRSESDRMWAGRMISSGAYAARITLAEPVFEFGAGARWPLHVRVANTSTERWPGDMVSEPLIRLSYRWHANGTTVVADGERSPIGVELPPGEETVVPLYVTAPALPARYELEVDLVHEHVRWFGTSLRVPFTVAPPRNPLGRTEPPSRGPLRTGPMRIPQVLHRVWLGPDPLPPEQAEFGTTWKRHHPDWEMRLWTDADLPSLLDDAIVARGRSFSEVCDLVRYEVLRRHGGVYVDTDVECLRPLDGLLAGVEAFAAWETDHRVGTAVLGAVPGHPIVERAVREARLTVGRGPNSAESTGPGFWSTLLIDHPEVTLFAPELFYPYRWDEPHRRHEQFPDAYAVHHWAASWLT